MVETRQALLDACERVRAAPRVALDTEFHNERSYAPRLMVLQLAFDEGAAVVDPLAVTDLSPLVDALAATRVVGHALASDLKIFADRFDRVPPNVFDCQIAAAFLGYGMSISLVDLVRQVCGVRLKKSQTVSDWSRRPLSPGQLEYLVDDVAYLLPIQDNLEAQLREKGRYDWAMDECAQLASIERYRTDERRMYGRIPGSNRMSRRELGVLGELLALRDRLARDRDVPVKYILPDDVLGGLATLRPKQLDDLSQLRRLDAGARRGLGSALLEAVRRGENIPEADLPQKLGRPLGQSRETLVSLMSVVVGEIGRENDVPPSMLVPRASLERVAREVPQDREQFERVLGVSAWRMALVAERLWHLLSGSGSLRIEGYTHGEPRILLQS